jgi:hypothetical protein
MICIIPCPKCGETLRVPEQVAAHPEEIECHMEPAPRDRYLRVRLTADQLAAIQRIAAQDGATVSEVVRRVVADLVRKRPAR